MPGLGTYWHTLRHLKLEQLYGRMHRRLRRPAVDQRPAPPLRATVAPRWMPPAPHPVSLIAPDRLRLLNQEHALGEHGWDDPALDLLWRYNLHYFDDLTAPDDGTRLPWQQALLARWVRENPPGSGTGWQPYPTSVRIVNWVKWALAGAPLPPEGAHSLAVQARWLRGRLERHLLGNHLFANAKALVFAGAYFEGPEAAAWLSEGLEILAREVPEQILPDGGQFERSPMYHALALEDMLDLRNILGALGEGVPPRWGGFAAELLPRIAAMRSWLAAMCHPDGDIGFFNDATLGIAPSRAALERYAERLGLGAAAVPGPGATTLASSGYIRIALGPAVALLDLAPVGPDYLPGHAHADTLSFELSLFGQRVLVNSGTSRYGDDDERRRQRGTAAHSTVVVDGADSTEVWSGFRVARRARPMGITTQVTDSLVVVRGGHDGYRRLPGRPEHWREWAMTETSLVISDEVTGRFGSAEARYHLHPDVVPGTPSGSGAGATELPLLLPGGGVASVCAEGALRVEPSSWHPGFGRVLPSRCLVLPLEKGEGWLRLTWSGGSA